MNAFRVVEPYVGMGATSYNVNGNLLPHTIIGIDKENNEVSTTLDGFSINKDTGETEYTTKREGEQIRWVLKDNANPSRVVYIPKNPDNDRYTKLIINTKQQYTNPNL